LEKFHAVTDATAVATGWPYLGSSDRFIRYAARIAVEHQPVNEWQEKHYQKVAANINPGIIAFPEQEILIFSQDDFCLNSIKNRSITEGKNRRSKSI
jgi:hypothetical protein